MWNLNTDFFKEKWKDEYYCACEWEGFVFI